MRLLVAFHVRVTLISALDSAHATISSAPLSCLTQPQQQLNHDQDASPQL